MTCFFVPEGLRRIVMMNATAPKKLSTELRLDKSSTSSIEEKFAVMGTRSYRLELWYCLEQAATVDHLRVVALQCWMNHLMPISEGDASSLWHLRTGVKPKQ